MNSNNKEGFTDLAQQLPSAKEFLLFCNNNTCKCTSIMLTLCLEKINQLFSNLTSGHCYYILSFCTSIPIFIIYIHMYSCIWLAPRAGKMNCILHWDWLPEQARWSQHYLLCSTKNNVVLPHEKSFIDQACSVKMAGYWPCSFACLE